MAFRDMQFVPWGRFNKAEAICVNSKRGKNISKIRGKYFLLFSSVCDWSSAINFGVLVWKTALPGDFGTLPVFRLGQIFESRGNFPCPSGSRLFRRLFEFVGAFCFGFGRIISFDSERAVFAQKHGASQTNLRVWSLWSHRPCCRSFRFSLLPGQNNLALRLGRLNKQLLVFCYIFCYICRKTVSPDNWKMVKIELKRRADHCGCTWSRVRI